MKRFLLLPLIAMALMAQETKPAVPPRENPVGAAVKEIKGDAKISKDGVAVTYKGDDAAKALNAIIKDLTDRALRAELRAAVAEKRLADQQIAQVQKLTTDAQNAAFKASCDAASIPLDKCEPDPKGDWSVRAKVEAPKPEEPSKK